MSTFLKHSPAFARIVAGLALFAYVSGCTTMRPVVASDAASFAAQIEAGDSVRITRNDISTVKFKVSELSDEGIGGDGTFVAWSEIRQVEVKKIDAARTGIAVAVSVLVIGLVAYLASDITVGPVFGPSGL